ncbi:MAG TPA: cation diffusion facilitator family transporter [Hyphomicrobiaceae bacterium]|nr:cation diffusion facilitator family transporter [Hyphomicrobiaceae bacterium]
MSLAYLTVASDKTRLAALGSIVVAGLVLGLKYLAYWLTGSVALYSDALESIVNLITALVALYAVHISAQPADRRHQFGHHKAEYFSAVLEGVLIVVAALLILREAYDALLAPRALREPLQGLAVNGLATALNAGWAYFLLGWGRRQRSPALVGDGWHLMTDVATSVGVIAGLLLAAATGWQVLDPALAALVAANILWAGWRLVSQSVSGLMDEAVTGEVGRRIRQIISENAHGAMEAHDVRTRMAGRVTFIELHLVVPGEMTVAASHAICDRIEAALKEAVHGAQVLIHVEPEDEAKQTGVPVV